MKRWTRVSIWGAAFIIGVGAGIFLITQGLSQAALWTTVIGLPIAFLGSAAGAWSAVLAARTLREARAASSEDKRVLKEAHVELVDALPDPDIRVSLTPSKPPTEIAPEQTHLVSDIESGYSSIDFKFINRGDATAVLHRFSLEILSFQPDLTPYLHHNYRLTQEARSYYRSTRDDMGLWLSNDTGTKLELEVSNDGWGSASQYTVRLTDPLLNRVFGESMLAFGCAEVPSGGKATFALQAQDAGQASLEQLVMRRKAILEKIAAATPSADAAIFDDEDFNMFLSSYERQLVRQFFVNYRPNSVGLSRGQEWYDRYISERDGKYVPIELDAEVRYLGEDDSRHAEQRSFSPGPPNSVVDGELYVGAEGFRFEDDTPGFSVFSSGEIYSVILDPEGPPQRDYSISRAISPGGADRFHILLAARRSGTFVVRLTFNVDRSALVRSDPISMSFIQPRGRSLPQELADGAAFEIRDGRLELGGKQSRELDWYPPEPLGPYPEPPGPELFFGPDLF